MRIFLQYTGFICALLFATSAGANMDQLQKDLEQTLGDIVQTFEIPGIVLSIRLDDERILDLAAGQRDRDLGTAMLPGHRMFSGSVGKTFVSVMMLELLERTSVSLDTKVLPYFEGEAWIQRMPNIQDLTIRHLLNHTSGLPRYIFQRPFMEAIRANPQLGLTPKDCLRFVFDQNPRHAAGAGWFYSDTNYLLLGLLYEKIAGLPIDDRWQEILQEADLSSTELSRQMSTKNLAQGHLEGEDYFGLGDRAIVGNQLKLNPGFEWTGGGLVTTAHDLAKWIKWLHEGSILSEAAYESLTAPVSTSSGTPYYSGYSLGNFVWSRGSDLRHGHSGYFPGYCSHVEYSTQRQYAYAFQINSDAVGQDLERISYWIDQVIAKHLDGLDVAAIEQNFEQQSACWNQGSHTCYMEAYATGHDIATVSRGGVTHGYQRILANYQRSFPAGRMGRLHFDEVTTRKLSDALYFVTGRFNLKFEGREELVQGWFSANMTRERGRWVMITDHSS
ncbi:MAG: serine hydrolase [Saprospiraceae bacterium]|nr:serine hydrolase [Saprospiraceae bacterium]